jgi:hypothetical protein
MSEQVQESQENAEEFTGQSLGLGIAAAVFPQIEQAINQMESNEQQQQTASVVDTTPQQVSTTSGNVNEQESENEEVIETPLGNISVPKSNAKASQKPQAPQTLDDLFNGLVTKFGIQAKDPQEAVKKMEEAVGTWRKQASELPEYKKKADGIEKGLSALPTELQEAIQVAASGGDWKSAVNNSKLVDFSKGLEKQEDKNLINHFFPGKFTEEQLEDIENSDDTAISIALEAAKEKFSMLKQQRDQKVQSMIKEAQDRQAAYSASIDTAFETLNESLPLFKDESAKADVRQVLESGDFMKLFIGNDGALKPDAAQNVLMVLKGKETIDHLTNFIRNRERSNVTEEFIERGNTKSPSRGSANDNAIGKGVQVSPELQRQLDILKAATKGKAF